jgi:Mg-chelatase subunit ChlD
MITLAQPIWLLLIIPALLVVWLWPAPTRFLQFWRAALLGTIILAMCWPQLKLPSRHGTVIVIADRSLSMPEAADQRQQEIVSLIRQGMQGHDRLGVVTFGQAAVVERPPDSGPLQPWVQQVVPDASNLAHALQRALSLVPAEGSSRLLILSDGRWTGSDPSIVAGLAASRSIPVDYRYMGRPVSNDLAIERLEAPRVVTPGEAFMIGAWIRSPVGQEVRYELMRDQTVIATGTREMSGGVNRLLFRDIVPVDNEQAVRTRRYTLAVTGQGEDPVPENNTAHLLVGIEESSAVLLVTTSPQGAGRGLGSLLRAGGLKVNVRQPGEVNWSLEQLSAYNGVVLENVPANTMTPADMETISQWVQQTGSGLLMTGGRQSFGPGGYFKSPLDPILPVSMELRQEHRKFSVAIVVAMDRSGSMTAPVSGGKTKMDLANLGAAQLAEMLSPMDELGVLAVDTDAHEIVPLTPVTNPQAIKNTVLRSQSMGGGIYVYEALEAAAAMVAKAKPVTKHIILFSDAADSENPGNYKSLLDKCEAAGITVSVIGLGSPSDPDAGLLEDIARRGRGRIYFTQDAMELPRLFAQDTFVVARSSFIEEVTGVSLTGGMVSIAGTNFGQPPAAGGYNLSYLKDGANLAMVTQDEYNAPFVATWQAGAGRVAAYSGEVDGKFTGPIAQWNELGSMIASLTRWTTGRNLPLPANMLMRQVVQSGQYRIELHLDPQRQQLDLPRMPSVSVLSGVPGQAPLKQVTDMQWVSPDTLAVEVTMYSTHTALATVDMGGLGVYTLPPVMLPYSPEFEPVREDQGQATLKQIARATLGQERVDVQGIWNDLTRLPRWMPVAHWIAILAIVMLLLEVFERRSGLISAALSRLVGSSRGLRPRVPADEANQDSQGGAMKEARTKAARRQAAMPTTSAGTPPVASTQGQQGGASTPPADTQTPPSAGGMADALNEARRRANRRSPRSE